MPLHGVATDGWLALLGGGEFTFGETLAADRAWLGRLVEGCVGFVPTASGSADYGRHFAAYLDETFGRRVDIVPLYRARDARRARNAERLRNCAAIYLGGGIADRLLETFDGTPCLEALRGKLARGGGVIAIAAAAQVCGEAVRSLEGGPPVGGWGLLDGAVVEANFDPAHDRRLRRLAAAPRVSWGLGLPAGAAVILGPDRQVEIVGGPVFVLRSPDGDLEAVGEQTTDNSAGDRDLDQDPGDHQA